MFITGRTKGSLSLTCSGEDYIISYDTEGQFYGLSIFAECSNSCSNQVRTTRISNWFTIDIAFRGPN